MACLFKQTTYRKDPKTGERVRCKSKKWWGRYRDSLERDRRVPLSTNKRAAQALLDQILDDVELARAGLVNPVREAEKKTIREHLQDFEYHLKGKNNHPRYIAETVRKINRCIERCEWRKVNQITALDVERFLAELRERDGLSIRTSNHYLRILKQFARWLVRNQRLVSNPLESISRLNENVDVRHPRRAFSRDELRRLIEAADQPDLRSKVALSGRTRAMIYRVAAWTGLRKGGIDSLTPRSFRLDADPPTVTVEASWSKRRRRDTQILHPDLVAHLSAVVRAVRAERVDVPDERGFGCGFDRKGAKMMRADLEAARNLWLAEDASLRVRSELFLPHWKDCPAGGHWSDFLTIPRRRG